MPLTKKCFRDKGQCRVTFSLPVDAAGGARKVFVAGEFNGWDRSLPMRRDKDRFLASIELATGQQYQYRYVTDRGEWLNDTAADCYVFSAFAGADNSVVML